MISLLFAAFLSAHLEVPFTSSSSEASHRAIPSRCLPNTGTSASRSNPPGLRHRSLERQPSIGAIADLPIAPYGVSCIATSLNMHRKANSMSSAAPSTRLVRLEIPPRRRPEVAVSVATCGYTASTATHNKGPSANIDDSPSSAPWAAPPPSSSPAWAPPTVPPSPVLVSPPWVFSDPILS